ncbi:MAG: hypothetical protein EOO81_05295 [Oxalobacteraceae bacterium]|nr:MAG: hypothetical protein EOO81_05295 [Oxalobacteraceae bacterium]
MELPDIPAADIERFSMLQAGLDLLDQGLTVFDANLGLVAWNAPFLRLLGFPAEMAYVGAPFESFIRYNAEHGEYGPGDVERQVSERVAIAARFAPHTTERVRPNGRVLLLRGEPLAHNGFVTLYTDITAQRHFEEVIQQQNVQLERRVLLRTAELVSANAELSSANGENTQIAAALGRSEARMRLINDSMPFLIGYVDKDEKYQYANKGYSDWFEVSLTDVMGSRVRDIIGAEAYGQGDPEKAAEAVVEAGYDATKPLRILTSRQYEFHYKMAEVAAEYLKLAGFNVQLDVVDWATLTQRRQDPKLWDIFISHRL